MRALVHRDGWLLLRNEAAPCEECVRRWWEHAPARSIDAGTVDALRDAVTALESVPGDPGTQLWVTDPSSGVFAIRPASPHPSCPRCPGGLARVGRTGEYSRALEALTSLVHPLRGPLHGLRVLEQPGGPDFSALAWVDRDNGELREVTGRGKGRGAARLVGALGECLERVAFFTDAPDTTPMVASELDGPWVDPRQMGLFAPEQYAGGLIPFTPYVEGLPIPWRRAEDLVRGSSVWLMHEGGHGSAPLCRGTSSGWAAHTDRTRARAGALLEVLERDALLTAWYGLSTPARLPLPASEDARLLEDRGVSITVVRLPHPSGVAAVLGLAEGSVVGAAVPRGGCLASCAADLDLEAAISATLRGLVQKLDLVDRLPPELRGHAPDALRMPGDHLLHYLDPHHGPILRAFVDQPEDRTRPKPLASIDELIGRIDDDGQQVLEIDATPKPARKVGLHVNRIVIPGLLPIAFGPLTQARLGGLADRARRLRVRPPARLPLDGPPIPD